MKIKFETGAIKPRRHLVQLVITPALMFIYDSKYVPYQDKEMAIILSWLWFEISVTITLNAPQQKSSKEKPRGNVKRNP